MNLFRLLINVLFSSRTPTSPEIDQNFTIEGPDYAGQRENLQSELGGDIFVAKYQAVVHENRLVTFSIWADGAVTALPKTDFIWLYDTDVIRWFVVSWSELETAIGPFRKIENVEPERFLTPVNIPVEYFLDLQKDYVPPHGFPSDIASG